MLLDDVFSAMDIEVDPFSLCEMAPRGWLAMPKTSFAGLHYVLSGKGSLHLDRGPSHNLQAGHLALVPAGNGHSLGAADGRFMSFASCRPAQLGLSHDREGVLDDGHGMTVLCAKIKLQLRGAGQVIDLLRQPLVVPTGHSHLIDLILDELATPGPGSRAQVKALLMFLIIAALRKSTLRKDSDTSWLVALADLTLWPAIESVINNPGADHSVQSLADTVGISRARFSERFKASFGTGPMSLVRDLRLQHGARLLLDGTVGIARIAALCGFSSRSHFSQAFEAHFGTSPGRYARSAAESATKNGVNQA